jgi:hypothetical protein
MDFHLTFHIYCPVWVKFGLRDEHNSVESQKGIGRTHIFLRSLNGITVTFVP